MTLKYREFTSTTEEFPSGALERWKSGDYGLLQESAASACLKRILVERNKKRAPKGPSYFFGEAWIVACVRPHVEGIYGSFKWLTAKEWSRSGRAKKSDSWHLEEYKTLLNKYVPFLDEIQLAAGKLKVLSIGPSSDKATRKKLSPSEPDLWLIDSAERHHFIEAKIHPKDEATKQQVAGLALISHHFRKHGLSVSTEVLTLYEQGSKRPSPVIEKKYCDWYKEIRKSVVT